MALPEDQIAAAQGRAVVDRGAQFGFLHVAVAGCRNVARVERRLHEPRAIDPEPGPAAPEIRDRQEALGDGDEIVWRGRIDRDGMDRDDIAAARKPQEARIVRRRGEACAQR